MNISVDREQLRTALSLAITVTDKRSTVPALACVLLRADKSLTVAASDLSTSYFTDVVCSVSEPGAVALDAKGLYDIVSSLAVDEVTIRTVDGKGEIRAGKSRFQVGAQSPDDFPKMPDVAGLNFATLDGPSLAKMIGGVIGCASQDTNRTMMAGVHLDLGQCAAMASDGHRAAIFRGSLGGKADGVPFLPRTGAATVLRAIGETKDVDVHVRADAFYLRVGSTVIGVKLLEAQFPAAAVGPMARAKSDHEVTVGREALLSSIKRVVLAAPKETYCVRMSFAPSKAALSANSSTAVSEDEIAVAYDGKGFECAFNATYVIGALEALTAEEVTFGFNRIETFEPIVLRPLAEEMGEEHVFVVMPMKH